MSKQFSAQENSINSLADAFIVSIPETQPNSPPWSHIAYDLLKQAGPNALRGAIVSSRYFLTAYFLGRLDERLLAPNTLISLMESLLVVLGSRSLNSISSEIGRLKGKGELENIGPVVRQGTLYASVIGISIGALYFANYRILQLFGQHEFAVDEARKYFEAAAPGYLALMLFTVQQRFYQGIKNSAAALYSSALHTALTMLLSYPPMFGLGVIPKLELTGAGYAFTVATWVTLIIHTGYLRFAKSWRDYAIFETKDTFNLSKIIGLARIGIPSGIQCAMENAANITNSIFLGRFGGLNALTADQVSLQLAQFISIVTNGLGGAINPCVSTALGKKAYHDASRYGYTGMLMGTALPVFSFALLFPLHESFTSIFLNIHNPNNTTIITLAKYFIGLECMRQLFTSAQVTTSGALQGYKDTKFPMIATIACAFVVNLALLFLFADGLKSNLQTLFGIKAVGFFMAAIFNLGRFAMKSHEVTDADKVEIAGQSTLHRLFRGVKLTLTNNQHGAQTDYLSATAV